MTKKNLAPQIKRVFFEVFKEQNERDEIPELTSDTILLDTGLDSLGFAMLVIGLEDELGFDPFISADDAFYPQTFAEFVSFYEENQPS